MLTKGCVDRDPMQMLYELLRDQPIVQNADPDKNFEDKYIVKFWKRIQTFAGKVEGEVSPFCFVPK